MNIEDFRTYCLQKKGATEDLPFDEYTLTYKVAGKIFALTSLRGAFSINLKCDPEEALLHREQYEAVTAGYHMSKKHWNTIKIDGTLPSSLILSWIDDSYNLVVAKLPKYIRTDLKNASH
ncbi:MAG: MmcQ/YjbR family DNA-binding protein [Bacteroidota bacterium]